MLTLPFRATFPPDPATSFLQTPLPPQAVRSRPPPEIPQGRAAPPSSLQAAPLQALRRVGLFCVPLPGAASRVGALLPRPRHVYVLCSQAARRCSAPRWSAPSGQLVCSLQFEETLNMPDPKEALQELIDPNLGGDYPIDSVLKLAYLAKSCTHEEPRMRPTMRSVVVALMALSAKDHELTPDQDLFPRESRSG